MRTTFEFDFVTTATPDQVVELMTDFSPNRPNRWPASSAKAFEVYQIGETEADIREGQDFPKLWAKWHYDWSEPNSVTLTIVESDALERRRFHVSHSGAPGRRRQRGARGVAADLEERARADRLSS